jgi:transcriptional regulator with XRE-family HTH domain
MSEFSDFLNKQLKDPKFKAEYEALEPDYAIIQAMIASGLTRDELAERTGIDKSYIRRLQNANANPSLSTLKRLAVGMGTKLKLEFLPIDEQYAVKG